MNTAPLATDSVVTPSVCPTIKPTYLNSRFGSHRPSVKSPLAQLEEMMTMSPAVELPVTSTLRLLEVSCGLTHDEVEKLLAPAPRPAAPSLSERVAQTGFYQRFGAIVWSLFLTGCVAAFLMALS